MSRGLFQILDKTVTPYCVTPHSHFFSHSQVSDAGVLGIVMYFRHFGVLLFAGPHTTSRGATTRRRRANHHHFKTPNFQLTPKRSIQKRVHSFCDRDGQSFGGQDYTHKRKGTHLP
jgi:hypothetical protein